MSRHHIARLSPLLLSAILLLGARASAQDAPDVLASLTVRLAGMSAVTGYERAMVDTMLLLLPGASRDRAGNAVRRGTARRLVACALDEPGWVVGGIRPDGWMTLRRSPGPTAALRDQQLEGARVTVWGRRSAVPGVVAVRSIHLTRQRGELPTGPFTADSAYLDVGAASANEVNRLGLGVLAVVTLEKRPHRYGTDLVAAPWAGRRAACAAVLAAAGEGPSPVSVALTVEHELADRGLAALARLGGRFEETLLVGAGDDSAREAPAELGRITRLTLPVRYPGTAVETVALSDVRGLARRIRGWMGGER